MYKAQCGGCCDTYTEIGIGTVIFMGSISGKTCRGGRRCEGVFAVTWRIALLAVIMLCGACAKKAVKPFPQPEDIALFSTAERLFQAGSYDDALAAYQIYLTRYPEKPSADEALMKIGRIHSTKGNFREEQFAFQRLISDYPQSPRVPDARLAYLTSLYKAGAYAAVIDQSRPLLRSDALSNEFKAKIHTLTGDTYTAAGLISEAMLAYAHAFELAGPTERNHAWQRFSGTIESLTAADFEQLLKTPPEGAFGGFFLYQLGLGFAELGNEKESVRTLSHMIAHYPHHPLVGDAKGVLDVLAKKRIGRKVTIGCLLPLTGAYQDYGRRALKGVELAVSRLGEEKADSFQLIVKDTASDTERSASAVREMCDAGVSAVIGPMLTAQSAAEAAQRCGVPIITLSGKEGIPDLGDYVFRNFITPRMQMEALVPYAVHVLGLQRFAVLYPEEKYGTTLMNVFWDEVLEQGGTVTGVEAYRPKSMDFTEPIKKLIGSAHTMSAELKAVMDRKARDLSEEPDLPMDDGDAQTETATEQGDIASEALNLPDPGGSGLGRQAGDASGARFDFDAVFIPDAADKVGLIVPQMAFHDIENVVLLGTNLWHSDDLINAAKAYVQGAVLPDGFYLESDQPHVGAFVKTFEAAFGESPGFIEAIAYDTAMMLFGLIAQTETIASRQALRDAIGAIKNYPGVTGRTSFTDTGDVTKELYLLTIKNDRFQPVQPLN